MPRSRSISTEPSPARRLLGRLVLLAGLGLGVVLLLERGAGEASLRYRLGDDHGRFERLELRYFHRGEEVAGARFDFPGGAPPTFDHAVRLPRGEVRVEVVLEGDAGSLRRTHRLDAPVDGTLVLGP